MISLELGVKSAPNVSAVRDDVRASVAPSSVRAAGSKPARSKWPAQLSDVASRVWTGG
jgi:hypothetical protein